MSGRSFGDAVAHSLRLENVPALRARTLRQSQIAISRLSIGDEQRGMSPQIPPEDSFIVAMYLTEVPYHELWSHGRPAIAQGYAKNSMRIVNLVEEYSAYITCPHETLVLYVPRGVLNEFTDEADLKRISQFRCPPGVIDGTMMHLSSALLPAFRRPDETSALFIDQVTCAMLTHLSSVYPGDRISRPFVKGGMSGLQMRRAKEFLATHVGDDISLIDAARACGLSRGHFAKAFRVSAGLTPHQWLQRHRIDKAKELLRNLETPIADIAIACGFADQSHLTRVFSRLVGDSPAAWRRRG
jgi:AraC family transcriptional regulator